MAHYQRSPDSGWAIGLLPGTYPRRSLPPWPSPPSASALHPHQWRRSPGSVHGAIITVQHQHASSSSSSSSHPPVFSLPCLASVRWLPGSCRSPSPRCSSGAAGRASATARGSDSRQRGGAQASQSVSRERGSTAVAGMNEGGAAACIMLLPPPWLAGWPLPVARRHPRQRSHSCPGSALQPASHTDRQHQQDFRAAGSIRSTVIQPARHAIAPPPLPLAAQPHLSRSTSAPHRPLPGR